MPCVVPFYYIPDILIILDYVAECLVIQCTVKIALTRRPRFGNIFKNILAMFFLIYNLLFFCKIKRAVDKLFYLLVYTT